MRPLQPLQQVRTLTKAEKEAERHLVVRLLRDVKKFGRAGTTLSIATGEARSFIPDSYVPVARGTMRNKWFPQRMADYVPAAQVKQLKAQGVVIERDPLFGVQEPLKEVEENDEDAKAMFRPSDYVRPVEIEMLSVRLVRMLPQHAAD